MTDPNFDFDKFYTNSYKAMVKSISNELFKLKSNRDTSSYFNFSAGNTMYHLLHQIYEHSIIKKLGLVNDKI